MLGYPGQPVPPQGGGLGALETLKRAAMLTGLPQMVQGAAWTAQHPLDRLQGQGMASEQIMQLPVGPWGMGFRGGAARVGPSLSKLDRFKTQDLAYQARLNRRAAEPLTRIPTQADAIEAMKQSAMRRAAVGPDPRLVVGQANARMDQVRRFQEDHRALGIPPYADAAMERAAPQTLEQMEAMRQHMVLDPIGRGELTSRTKGAADIMDETRLMLEGGLLKGMEKANPLQQMLISSAIRTMTHTPARRFAARMDIKGPVAQDLKWSRIYNRQLTRRYGKRD